MPTGKVKWYDAEKGFGFLSQEDGPDVYVRAEALPEGITTVKAGTRVEFGIAQGRRGDQALQVRVLDEPTSVARNQSQAKRRRPDEMVPIIEDLIRTLDDIGEGFRHDTGFVNQSGVRKLEVEGVRDRFAAWFPDGRSLLVAHEGGAARVDAATGRVVARYVAEGSVVFVGAVTPDGAGVVLGAEGGALTLHDASSGGIRRRFAGHKTDVTCLVVSADGRTAISGGAEGAIYVWDLVD